MTIGLAGIHDGSVAVAPWCETCRSLLCHEVSRLTFQWLPRAVLESQ